MFRVSSTAEKLMPFDLSTPTSPALDPEEVRSRKMKRRSKVIQELVQTEKDFLTDLELCIREVVQPLRNMQVRREVFIQAKAALEDVYKVYYPATSSTPVQRIMKYPLLLGELWQTTPENHPDYQPVQEAFTAAKIINININEFKRRKDIVMKYKRSEDEGTLRGKFHKFNIHSIRKKGDRFAGFLKILTGVEPQVRDEVFDREEKLFRSLEKAVRQMVKNVQCYVQEIQVCAKSVKQIQIHFIIYVNFNSCGQEMVSVAVQNAHDMENIIKEFNKNNKNGVEQLVLAPLSSLQGMFTAPQKLIQKRYDKLLDYCSRLERSSSLAGPARRDYEALNAMLVEELQRFNMAAHAILINCVVYLVALLKQLMEKLLLPAPSLHQLPVSSSSKPKTFIRTSQKMHNNEEKKIYSGPSFIIPEVQHQTEEQRAWLLAEYPLERIYQLKRKCNGCQEQDLSLLEGELVALLEDSDPFGSSSRWLVHSGGHSNYALYRVIGVCALKRPAWISKCVKTLQTLPPRQESESSCLFYAVYAFQARCDQELSLQEYQHVRILKFCDLGGNKEWWLAESNGQKGYVPANYLGKMSYA
uniref:Uncharacterized protein n=1 Tax=Periophthalmus magnuspinnatus TaxID=409849 RepID=A0A3B4B3D6_9GOBI